MNETKRKELAAAIRDRLKMALVFAEHNTSTFNSSIEDQLFKKCDDVSAACMAYRKAKKDAMEQQPPHAR